MNRAINIEELSADTQRQLAGVLEVIPGKWEVYAKVLLLVMTLNSLPEAKWVINRLRRELDNMGKNMGGHKSDQQR